MNQDVEPRHVDGPLVAGCRTTHWPRPLCGTFKALVLCSIPPINVTLMSEDCRPPPKSDALLDSLADTAASLRLWLVA